MNVETKLQIARSVSLGLAVTFGSSALNSENGNNVF